MLQLNCGRTTNLREGHPEALPPTGLVKKSLKPKYFPDFFQLTLKRCIFAVSLNLEKV